MRIALVSKTNGSSGGASFFAENFGAWLMEAGHEVRHFCMQPRRALRAGQMEIPCAGLASRLARHANWQARRYGMVEPLPWEYWFGLGRWLDEFELVHFHDLYMAISPRSLAASARRKPVIVTAHDCSMFTGGCLYPMGCRRFTRNCGECPSRAEIGRFDFTRSNLNQMRRLSVSANVHYVFPSEWIRSEAASSLVFKGQAVHIANGFDPRAYKFQDRNQARVQLGLPRDRKIVVVSSSALADHRKGMLFAIQALVANRDLNPFVLLIGKSSPDLERSLEGLDFLAAGFVEDRTRMGLLYAAADVLLFSSLADNLPITIQEALAAATPVLAFAVGGVPELVRHGETGWLVPAGDQPALNRQLREVLLSKETAGFGRRGRALIAEEFSVGRCVDRHLALYRSLLNGHH